jgi:RHS repeat-associated protein
VVSNQTPTTNNGTTHYVWNIFGQIIAEADGTTGNTLRETVYLDGMPLAAVDVLAAPKKLYAVHVDHLNRPIMLTDAAKLNVRWASYEPFGKVRATGGALTQNLGLPGQWFQLETGLAYNWHRHYDPTIGRYTTADPLGFVDGPSVYAYAGNMPHMVVDENGLISKKSASKIIEACLVAWQLLTGDKMTQRRPVQPSPPPITRPVTPQRPNPQRPNPAGEPPLPPNSPPPPLIP